MNPDAFQEAVWIIEQLAVTAQEKTIAERKLMHALDYVNETGRA